MFSLPIVFAGLGLMIVLAAVRRARRATNRPTWTVVCPRENCRFINRPFARFCSRCGRTLMMPRRR